MIMSRTRLISDKRLVFVVTIILYIWLFVLDDDPQVGPEQLEQYRGDLKQWVEDNEELLREEQRIRRQQVQDVCEKYGINKKTGDVPKSALQLQLSPEEWNFHKRVNWYYIYLSKPESLVWCKVPKAGSSTWTFNFLKLAGIENNGQKIHKALRDHFPKQSNNKVMQGTFRFMVVRHPFERILSAYRDKLEDLSRDLEARDGYYYTRYGKAIVSEYRKKKNNAPNEKLDMKNNVTNERPEPTWKEFITYLLSTPVTKYDEHWTPIWMLCSPCIVRYDVIAKMETFSEDTMFTIAQAGLGNKLSVEWKHRTGTGGSSDTIAEYFSQLTKSEVAALFSKYRLDFELYGYDPEPYFDIAKEDSEM